MAAKCFIVSEIAIVYLAECAIEVSSAAIDHCRIILSYRYIECNMPEQFPDYFYLEAPLGMIDRSVSVGKIPLASRGAIPDSCLAKLPVFKC